MKNIFLSTVLSVTTLFCLGQCATTNGEEMFFKISYFKCDNGYLPPNGFEWMKPTKIYFSFDNLTGPNYSKTSKVSYVPYAVRCGDNLQTINDIYAKEEGGQPWNTIMGFRSITNKQSEADYYGLCLDCKLGYWAAIQLIDDFIPNYSERGGQGYPNQALGYCCGQPTAEAALKLAWENARKTLGKPAVGFYYCIGTNAKPQTDAQNHTLPLYYSQGESLRTYADYIRQDKNFGYSKAPDDAEAFINFVKKREKFYFQNSKDNFMYGCFFNEEKNENGATKEYPIFKNKIDAGKPSGNAQNTQDNSLITTETNKGSLSLLNLRSSLDADTKNLEAIKQNILNYFKEMGMSVINKVVNTNTGIEIFTLDNDKTVYLYALKAENKIIVSFKGKYIKMGQDFNKEIKSEMTSGVLIDNSYEAKEFNLAIDLKQGIKITHTSPNFKILSPQNYTVLDIYPRTTNVTWTKVDNAIYYQVIVQFAQGENADDFTKASNYVVMSNDNVYTNNFSFQGAGSNVHRYRVLAKKGAEIIAETDWNYIYYKQ